MQLRPEACSVPAVLAQVEPKVHPQLRLAVAQISGVTFQGCWVEIDQTYYIVYEDGDHGILSPENLHPVREI